MRLLLLMYKYKYIDHNKPLRSTEYAALSKKAVSQMPLLNLKRIRRDYPVGDSLDLIE